MTALARMLTVLAIALGTSAYVAAIYIGLTLCGILAALAAACVIGAGLIGHLQRTNADCGYATTPYGLDSAPNRVTDAPPVFVSRIVHTPAVALAVIEGGKRPVWDTEIWGAPE
ncbi:hypothetical protein [Mycobacterium sp. NAZ190054]|uniref:hypothetical protein n=1 Tax=Mycobacterium sp. NAZ190054 TaxID=1747766 RepID=UPI00079A1F7B|nr:hypothetical protein [Mycobacterium sp. NAZ190054]KWX66840.1 hypothetical protein ASJ79_05600 [Mycobacterium sp. NAZ190054]